MHSRTSAALSLLVTGLLVAAPLSLSSAFADETDPAATPAETTSAPVAVASAEEAPVAEAAAAEVPTEESPVDVAPVDVAPVDVAPVGDAPVDGASAADDPAATRTDAEGAGSAPIARSNARASIQAASYQGAPAPATGLSATHVGDQWTLSWNASSPAPDDTRYIVYFLDEDYFYTHGYQYIVSNQIVSGTSFSGNWHTTGSWTLYVLAQSPQWGSSGYFVSIQGHGDPAPGAPTGVEASISHQLDGVSFTLDADWSASNGAERYDLSAVSTGGVTVTSSTTGTSASMTLPHLVGQTWSLTVTAVNDSGSNFSTVSDIAYPIVAPDAPQNVTVTRGAEFTGFHVTWDAPDFDGGEPITSYTVYATDSEGHEEGTYVEGGESTSADLEGVTIGETYTITVFASTDNNSSDSASDGAPHVLSAIAPTAPDYVDASTSGVTEVDVEWGEPSYDGGSPITGYLVTVSLESGGTVSDTFGADDFEGSIEVGDQRFAEYAVTVAAINAAELTGPTAGDSGAFGAAQPGLVHFTATAVGYHDPTVVVDWTAPDDGGSDITGYAVVLLGADGNPVGVEELPADARSFTFTGLTNGTAYAVVVIALNDVGVSEADEDDLVAVTTLGAAPVAPILPAADLGGATVTIANGVVTATIPGAAPGTWFYAYAFSTPTSLGWAQVAANGTVSWNIAAANLPAGTHHLAVLSNTGALVSSTGFAIAGAAVAPAAVLASTGAESGTLIAGAAALILAGLALSIRRRTVTVRAGR